MEMKESVKQYIKGHASKGLFQAASKVRQELVIFRRHRAGVAKARQFREASGAKLNLGCGPNLKAGWINVDLFDSHADLQLDLREGWPFADGRISHIYSEHVFEHFEFQDEVPHFLAESFRVLKSGGVFEVGVPGVENMLKGYGDPNNPVWHGQKNVHPSWCETQLDHINYTFRQGTEHKYAWDFETLSNVLRKAGFVNIIERDFDPACDTRTGTLFIKASKP
jgi:predicted SAM-dependent methyltransferase